MQAGLPAYTMGQGAGCRIQLERANGAAVLTDGVKEPAGRVEGEEAWSIARAKPPLPAMPPPTAYSKRPVRLKAASPVIAPPVIAPPVITRLSLRKALDSGHHRSYLKFQ